MYTIKFYVAIKRNEIVTFSSKLVNDYVKWYEPDSERKLWHIFSQMLTFDLSGYCERGGRDLRGATYRIMEDM